PPASATSATPAALAPGPAPRPSSSSCADNTTPATRLLPQPRFPNPPTPATRPYAFPTACARRSVAPSQRTSTTAKDSSAPGSQRVPSSPALSEQAPGGSSR